MLLTYSGRPLDALAVLELHSPPPTNRRARSLRALAEVPALVATGRCATRSTPPVAPSPSRWSCPTRSPSLVPACTSCTQIYALTECGRLDDAVDAGHRRVRGHTGDRAAGRSDVAQSPARAGARCSAARSRRPALARGGARPVRRARHHRSEPARAVRSSPPRTPASATPTPPRPPRWRSWTGVRTFPFARPSRSSDGRGRWWPPATSPAPADVLLAAARPRVDHRLPGHRGVAPPRRRPPRRSGLGRRSPRRAGVGMRGRPRRRLRRATRPPRSPADRRRSSR